MMAEPSNQPINLAQQDLLRGQKAFEAGQYRVAIKCLEQALGAAAGGTAIHGEITIWLVTAYEAAGDRQQAKVLCKIAAKHAHWETRKEGKRLLYILDAPVLRRREDWQTKIPNLEALDEKADSRNWGTPVSRTAPPRQPISPPTGYQIPEPTDPNQVEIEDGAFIWVVFGLIGVVLVGLAWTGFAGG